jgi:hypothetical protein
VVRREREARPERLVRRESVARRERPARRVVKRGFFSEAFF